MVGLGWNSAAGKLQEFSSDGFPFFWEVGGQFFCKGVWRESQFAGEGLKWLLCITEKGINYGDLKALPSRLEQPDTELEYKKYHLHSLCGFFPEAQGKV